MGYLPGDVFLGGVHLLPRGQTETCENNLSATTVADGNKNYFVDVFHSSCRCCDGMFRCQVEMGFSGN